MKTQMGSRRGKRPLITRTPGVVGGSPVIDGTRIRVADVVYQARFARETSNDEAGFVVKAYPHVTHEQVAAALEYYARHKAEIDTYMSDEERLVAEWSQDQAST